MVRLRVGQRLKLLAQGTEVSCTEHAKVCLEGLLPNSAVKCRVVGEMRYTRNGVQADDAGRIPDVLKVLEIHGLPDDYEVFCRTPEGPIEFRLCLTATFSDVEVDLMIREIGSADYKWDADNRIPSRVKDLAARVNAFASHHLELHKVLNLIVAKPSQRLARQQAEVPLHGRYTLSPRDLLDNLRRGLLDAGARPTADKLLAHIEEETPDTPENAYVVQVSRRYRQVRQQLWKEIEDEKKRLEEGKKQLQEQYEQDDPKKSFSKDLALLNGVTTSLESLPKVSLPHAWHGFQSPPARVTNRVRYDPLYASVAALEDRLEPVFSKLERESGLRESLVELGRRKSWQVYEYWVVAKVYEALRKMKFDPVDPNVGGFAALEDTRGARYGLTQGSYTSLQHREMDHLRVKLFYDRAVAVDKSGKEMRPDIRLELTSEGDKYQGVTLILDAKASKLGDANLYQRQKTVDMLKKSARRYRNEFRKGKAAAYLLHRGFKEAWPARGAAGDTSPFLNESDFPYLGGICPLVPRQGENVSLQRILTAWFLSNNILSFCFRCGTSFGEDCKKPLEEYQRPKCEYPNCGLTVVVNYCMECRRSNAWSKIPKIYHKNKSEKLVTDRWVEDIEIARRPLYKQGLRHCPKCGSSKTSL